MAKGDVQLIIRAKNEASAALDAISDAMKRLALGQEGVKTSGEQASGTLTRLGQEASKALSQLSGSKAFATVEQDVDKATAAFSRQEFELSQLIAQQKALEVQSQGAARVQAAISAEAQKAAAVYGALKQQLKEAEKSYKDLNAQTEGKKAKSLSSDDLSVFIARASNAAARVLELKDGLAAATTVNDEFSRRVSLVSQAQADLDRQYSRTTVSLSRETEAVEKSRTALQQLGSTATAVGQQRILISAAQAEADKAAARAGSADTNAARRESLEVKKALIDALTGTQDAWKTAQDNVRALAAEMAKAEEPSKLQTESFAKIVGQAQAAKTAYKELQGALLGVSTSLRNTTSSQNDLVSAQKRAAEALDQAKGVVSKSGSTSGLVSDVQAASANQAQAAQAATAAAEANAAAVRRAALEAKRDLVDLAATAEKAWLNAQDGVRALSVQINASGVPTRAEATALAQLAEQAKTSKTAFLQLQVALSEVNSAFRNSQSGSTEFAAAQTRASGAVAAIGAVLRQVKTDSAATNNLLRQTGADAREAASGFGQYGDVIDPIDDKIKRLNDGHRQTLSIMERLRGQVLGLAASYLGLQNAISQIGGAVVAFQGLEAAQNRLNVVFGGDKNTVREELDWLNRNASRLGVSFADLADGYSKLAVAAKGTALEGEGVKKVFLNFTEFGRVNKLTADQMQSVFKALADMLSKGTISAQDLKVQLGNVLPGAFQDLATAIGKTAPQLAKAMEAGLIRSDALLPFADQIKKIYKDQLPDALKTTTTELGKLQNNIVQAQLAFAQGGFIEAFTESVRRLNGVLRSSDGISTLQSLSVGAGVLVKALATIPEHMRLILVSTAAFVGLKAGVYLVSMAGAAKDLAVGIKAAWLSAEVLSERLAALRLVEIGTAEAATTLGATVSGLGGVWGLAIAGVVTGLAYWLTRTNDATTALSDHQQLLTKVKDGYEAVGKNAEAWRKSVERTTLHEATKTQDELRGQVGVAFAGMAELGDTSVIRAVKTSPAVDFAGSSAASIQTLKDQVAQVQNAFDKLRAGTLSVDEFKKIVDGINQKLAPGPIREWTGALIESAEKAREVITRYKQAQDIVTGITGSLGDAQKALDRVTGGGANQATEAAAALVKYKDAVLALKTAVPLLNTELERQQKLIAISDNLGKGLSATKDPAQQEELNQIANRARAAVDPKLFLQDHNATGSDLGIKGLSDEVAKKLADAIAQLPTAVAKGISITKGFITVDDQLKAFNAAKAADPNSTPAKPGTSPFEKGDAFQISAVGLTEVEKQKLIAAMAQQGYILTASQLSEIAATSVAAASRTTDGATLRSMSVAARKSLKYNDPVLDDYATYIEQSKNLPHGLINALKNAGERSNSDQVSPNRGGDLTGAEGVMQFEPPTFKRYGKGDPKDPVNSIEAAGNYVADMLQRYGNSIKATIVEYNGGTRQARAVMAGGEPWKPETIAYNKRVSSYLESQGTTRNKIANTPGDQLTFTQQSSAEDGAMASFKKAEQLRTALDHTISEFQAQADVLQGKTDKNIDQIIRGVEEKFTTTYEKIDQLEQLDIASGRTDLKVIEQKADAQRRVVNELKNAEIIAARQKNNKDVAKDSEQELARLVALQSTIRAQIDTLQKDGRPEDADRLDQLRERFTELTPEINAAAEAARDYATALGGPEGEQMLLRVEQLKNSVRETKSAWQDASAYNKQFADGASTAILAAADGFGKFVKGTGSLGDAFRTAGQAARKFFADFLRQIAEAILKAAILKAITGSADGGPGGIGGFVVNGLSQLFNTGGGAAAAEVTDSTASQLVLSSVAHTGAVIGIQGGSSRSAPAGWFTNAVKYHGGGVVGLKPKEVPSVLEQGEEVLTRTDPRHVMNGGKQQANAAVAPSLKIVNAFDSETVVNEGLSTSSGEKAIMNIIRGNKSAIRSILG